MAAGRHGLIAGLDVGTTKVVCFIARLDGQVMRVVGIGHQVSRGMRAGAVVDMEGVEQSVRAAVDAAERMAETTIEEVYVSISGGQPHSHTVGVEVSIGGHEVGEADIRRVLEQGRHRDEPGERRVIHALPVGYTIDGTPSIRDPRGLFADRLGVNMHVVTVSSAALRNLVACVERGHLRVAGVVSAPYADGLAALVEDEMDLGVTMIDMGGGSTSIGIFYDGNLVHTDHVPIGGMHVTRDVARGLGTSLSHAERLKTLYGNAMPSTADEAEMIDVPQVGENEEESANHMPRSLLVGIIRPRIEETLELVRDKLRASQFDRLAGRRIVLCGGASQLQGVRELAQRILDRQARIARPIRVAGLAEATGGPAFATCAGLLSYAKLMREQGPREVEAATERSGLGLKRLGRWLRANL
jgi:cell division protein FtsA